MNHQITDKILRVLLLSAAFGWGISILGVFMPWEWAAGQLEGLGAVDLPHDPMLDYWLRMAAGAFTGIGIFFFILALNPYRFRPLLPYIGLLHFIEGLILLIHGIRLGLYPIPFYVDTAFCLTIGLGIFLLRNPEQTK